MTKNRNPVGRPSKYTPKLLGEICDRLSEGEPLAEICRDAHMPDASTVRDWQSRDETVARRIAIAREVGFDEIAAEVLRIADTPCDGVCQKLDAEGKVIETTVEDMLGHRRLQIDTRLKLLSKWDPKRYGERVQHANDPDNPMPTPQVGVVIVPAKRISGEDVPDVD